MAAKEGAIEIEEIISAAEKKDKERYKSTEVTKSIEPQIDLGNLLVVDQEPIINTDFKKEKNVILKEIARDNTQLLFNAVWKLPIERSENVVVVKLPGGEAVLPREKPIPKPKPLTKWQEFAKRKGIVKAKRGRMIWDDATKSWKPRWGFKRGNDQTKDWFIEVPNNADPYEDQFLKREKEKKERVAKNEFQRLKNIAKSPKSTTYASTLSPSQRPSRDHMKAKINAARVSTASMGKFTPKVQNEILPKKTGKKRKFETVAGNTKTEQQRNLEIFGKIGKPHVLDVKKAANRQMNEEQRSKENKGKSNKRTSSQSSQGSNTRQGKNKKQRTPVKKGKR